MKIDFNEIVKALKYTGYNGYFTLEADQFLREYTGSTVFEGIKQLAAAAKKLAALYESC